MQMCLPMAFGVNALVCAAACIVLWRVLLKAPVIIQPHENEVLKT